MRQYTFQAVVWIVVGMINDTNQNIDIIIF
jgi:hypothetical protein